MLTALLSVKSSSPTQGPTIFPIIFAAICGRWLKALAAWRLEIGTSVGFAEQMMGSRTISSAIVTQFKLKALNLTALFLILLWALSPVGGQATLRAVGTRISIQHTSRLMSYVNINTAFQNYASVWSDVEETVNSAFLATLASPVDSRRAEQDLWGNVRIPILEYTNGFDIKNESAWLEVTSSTAPVFSSLIGVPMGFQPLNPNKTTAFGNASLTMETAYWLLDCSPLQAGPQQFGKLGLTTARRPERVMKDSAVVMARNITLDSRGRRSDSLRTTCSIITSYVQVNVSCIQDSCTVSKIRRSPVGESVAKWTALDISESGTTLFLQYLNTSSTPSRHRQRTALEGYLIDPDSPFTAAMKSDVEEWDLTMISVQDLSLRFSQLLNTYWIMNIAPFAIVNNNVASSPNSGYQDWAPTPELLGYNIGNATVDTMKNITVLQYHRIWLGLLLLASIVLFACAVAALFTGMLRRAPDILDSFSSLTRDNDFMTTQLQQGGSYLDGSERARLIRNVRVKLGDVAQEEDVGHIAIGTVGEKPIARLQSSRLYD